MHSLKQILTKFLRMIAFSPISSMTKMFTYDFSSLFCQFFKFILTFIQFSILKITPKISNI